MAAALRRIKFKLHDKKGPLELLGRRFNAFPSRHEHTGPDGKPIQHEVKEVSLIEVARRIAYKLELGAAEAAKLMESKAKDEEER